MNSETVKSLLLIMLVLATRVAASAQAVHEGDTLRLVPGREAAALLERCGRAVDSMLGQDPELGKLLKHRLSLVSTDNSSGYLAVQQKLDPFCLLEVAINPESRVKVSAGPAARALQLGVWRNYLVKVVNEAGVTAPLRVTSPQSVRDGFKPERDEWLDVEVVDVDDHALQLSGAKIDYRIVRLRSHAIGKRAAILAADVGQGTADIGFRNDTMITFACTDGAPIEPQQARKPTTASELDFWLRNIFEHHRFSVDEARAATGLSFSALQAARDRLIRRPGFSASAQEADRLRLLPYPGGRHPRAGFREASVAPQRETKASVFTPWDPNSYVVVDVPEAIWSNLGLTYLAHRDLPTIWEEQGVELGPLEWDRSIEGELSCERALPNGVRFGVRLVAEENAVRMRLWLGNGSQEPLANLSAQVCVLLAQASGFSAQTNDNKISWGPYAACSDDSGRRWVVTAWDRVERAWGNEDCPCLHSDPRLSNCEPGETVSVTGRLWFYEGADVHGEMLRVERTGWRESNRLSGGCSLRGVVLDAETRQPIPARVHIDDGRGNRHTVRSEGGQAIAYRREMPHLPQSPEVHTSLSPHPFAADLPPGDYTIRVEHGKDFLPYVRQATITKSGLDLEILLHRWVDTAERGWYSGDVHVHRTIDELPTAMLAEDLNVAFPLTQWVTDSRSSPADTPSDAWRLGPVAIDSTHVYQPRNTEYEIVTLNGERHLLGSCLILNQSEPLTVSVPPVSAVAAEARRQGALIDLEKHSWPWSLVLAPVMEVDLFELANNHLWQTDFGLHDFTVETVAGYMRLDRDERGLTERGWLDYGLETYYALLNCGLDMRVSAGTASGVHPVPLGFGRVYVHLDGEFSLDGWVDGLSRGRSFVSNGPLLFVEFNGEHPGAEFHAKEGEKTLLEIEGETLSREPLERIEIVHNGVVAATVDVENTRRAEGGYKSRVVASLTLDGSGWVAVRCFESHPHGRVRFAHTNPVSVKAPGRPLLPRPEQIDYLVDRVRTELRDNSGRLDQESVEEFREALRWYESIADRVHEAAEPAVELSDAH